MFYMLNTYAFKDELHELLSLKEVSVLKQHMQIEETRIQQGLNNIFNPYNLSNKLNRKANDFWEFRCACKVLSSLVAVYIHRQ